MAELKPCKCGGRPKFERFCGWWHIECKKCREYPVEYLGDSRVWGWNTKQEAAAAWNRMADTCKWATKPMTNADKHFHNATDEQLAEYLSELSTAPSCTGKCHKDYEIYGELRTFCRDCWLAWLKQEVKDNA